MGQRQARHRQTTRPRRLCRPRCRPARRRQLRSGVARRSLSVSLCLSQSLAGHSLCALSPGQRLWAPCDSSLALVCVSSFPCARFSSSLALPLGPRSAHPAHAPRPEHSSGTGGGSVAVEYTSHVVSTLITLINLFGPTSSVRPRPHVPAPSECMPYAPSLRVQRVHNALCAVPSLLRAPHSLLRAATSLQRHVFVW